MVRFSLLARLQFSVVMCVYCISTGIGGFLPAVKQIANVAALPGIVGVSHISVSLI
jgi:hypothetical protein